MYTEVARDGLMAGPAVSDIQRMLDRVGDRAQVIVAGGVGSLEDIRVLRRMSPRPPDGVIVGRALYEGKVTLKEALAVGAG